MSEGKLKKEFSKPDVARLRNLIQGKNKERTTSGAGYSKSYGECLNCRTKFETKLKLEGKWEEYIKNAHNLEIDHLIGEYKQFYTDKLQESNQGFVTEAGDVEKWNHLKNP